MARDPFLVAREAFGKLVGGREPALEGADGDHFLEFLGKEDDASVGPRALDGDADEAVEDLLEGKARLYDRARRREKIVEGIDGLFVVADRVDQVGAEDVDE
jgi:hypothetical protein